MSIKLKDLLKRNIFDSYKIITSNNDLEQNISGVSILETPDFEKYIIDGTLILTTFYIINRNIEMFKNLIITLSKHQSPGIVIKLYRYIDEIPESIITLANHYKIPILALDYDANLSLIFNSIYSELQSNVYLEHNFHSKFVDCLALIEKNPSTASLLEANKDIDNLDIFIYNYETHVFRYTNPLMIDLWEDNKNNPNQYIKKDDNILYKQDVFFENKKIYMFMLYTTNSNRHIINTYSEIYNILITIIYQKKKETILLQDRFLVNFISNFTSYNSTNQDMIAEGKLYNWNIEFPLTMILFTFNDSIDKLVNFNNNLPYQIKSIIIECTKCESKELKYIFFDNKILFIKNSKKHDLSTTIHTIQNKVYDVLQTKKSFTIAYTNDIHLSADIPSHYRNLIEVSNYISIKNGYMIIDPNIIEFIKIMKEFNSNELNTLLKNVIQPLLEYEKNHDINLCDTLLTYFQSHFNLREAAEKLYIHYNTLKHRLSIVEKLGYNI
ncbi:MAG: PucR family transcriptional regulator, partial [Traorella sp.]